MKITALVHTRNEERWLEGCLATLTWADELLVADMSSTDRTREIAARYGARILEMPVAPIVEHVRAMAIAQCSGDWILIVDADERVTPALPAKLRDLAATTKSSAFRIPRKNYFFDEWMEHVLWPDFQVRFLRRGTVDWPTEIHSLPKVTGTIENLEADPLRALEHPGAYYDMDVVLSKAIRYGQSEVSRIGSVLKGPIWIYVLRRPITEFLGRYFGGGWKHGIHGLMQCLVMANYQFVAAIQYWATHRHQEVAVAPHLVRRRVAVESVRNALRTLRWFLLRR